jgi:hypothetical protein
MSALAKRGLIEKRGPRLMLLQLETLRLLAEAEDEL